MTTVTTVCRVLQTSVFSCRNHEPSVPYFLKIKDRIRPLINSTRAIYQFLTFLLVLHSKTFLVASNESRSITEPCRLGGRLYVSRAPLINASTYFHLVPVYSSLYLWPENVFLYLLRYLWGLSFLVFWNRGVLQFTFSSFFKFENWFSTPKSHTLHNFKQAQ